MKRDVAAYKTKRWQLLRKDVLLRDQYTCQDCNKMVGIKKYDAHVDHIQSVESGGEMWDKANLQTLCQHCHNAHKQSYERTGRKRQTIGLDGWPVS